MLRLSQAFDNRRCFDRALSNDRARAEFAISQIGLLYEIERKADEESMSFDERKELRLRLAPPILQGFESWL